MSTQSQTKPSNNPLENIAMGMIAPTPTIGISDPLLFNTCLAAKADGDIRNYLNYLSIDPETKTVTGCNGHTLVSGEALDFSNWKSKEKILLLPAKKLPKQIIYASINLKTKLITGMSRKSDFSIPFATIKAKHPTHEHLQATNENRITEVGICFNPQYLTSMQKASGCNSAGITAHLLESGDRFYSIELLASQIKNKYRAVIMPIHREF